MNVSSEAMGSYKSAKVQYDVAFHLLKVTYPLIKDPRLLLGIVANLSSCLQHCMDAILYHEQELKLISACTQEFQSKFNLFRYKCVARNNIPPTIVLLIQDLQELLALHKRSAVEFQRGDKLVISERDYRLKVITAKDIQDHVNITKLFLEQTKKIVCRFDQK